MPNQMAQPEPLTPSMLDECNLKVLHAQAQKELEEVRTRITELEARLVELEGLRLKAAQLEGLERQLKYMVRGEAPPEMAVTHATSTVVNRRKRRGYAHAETLLPKGSSGAFFPEKAYLGADEILQYRHSVNYEIFRAVVLNGGQASTRDIRDYLIEHRITTPAGKTFEATRLSEVSARTAYLVKKGVIQAVAPGRFQSCFGWE